MVNCRKRLLGANDRRVLEMLAASGSCGCIHSELLTRGFTVELLGLVRDGLAAVATETVKAGGRQIEVARVRITDPGWQALVAEGGATAPGVNCLFTMPPLSADGNLGA
jgi:hypothetical protein